MASKASLEKQLRDEIIGVITKALAEYYDLDTETQIEFSGSGTFSIPVTDAENNDKWPQIKVSIPRGTRNGEGGYIPFDGHEAAEAYKAEKASQAQERAVRKAMKEAEKKKKKEEEE